MRRSLAIGALLIGFSGLAQAADLAPTATAPFFDWAGPFLGVNGGFASGTSSWTAGGVTTGNFGVSGGMAGLTAGYNFQMGPWVYGGVGDIDWQHLSGSTATKCSPNCATTSGEWFSTIRGRLGYAQGPFLPYLTAGAAIGNISAHFIDNSTGSSSGTRLGWTAGGGAEVSVQSGWSVWGEVLYADLGSIVCSTTVCSGPPTAATVPLTETIFRAGINRKF